MKSFKQMIAHDNANVFLNLDEFADDHIINGKPMKCIIDNNEAIDRERRYQYKRSLYADGVYMKELLIYVLARQFGPLPAVGRMLVFDGKTYLVADAINEDGIYSLTLEANKT